MDPIEEMPREHYMTMDPMVHTLQLAVCGVFLVRRMRINRQRLQEETRRTEAIPRPPRMLRTCLSIDGMSDRVCRKRYRLNRAQLLGLYEVLKDDLEVGGLMHTATPGLTKMLCCLQFLASGNIETTVADLGGIATSTFSNLLYRFLSAMRSKYQQYVGFPSTPQGWRAVKLAFFELGGIPKVLGAIDCTHIEIKAPSHDSQAYLNGKHYYSLNVQMVCDASMRIMSVFAPFPGSAHDSFILDNSPVARDFQNDRFPDGWLLGDSGYPLRAWLMTPCRTPGAAHKSYNQAHEQAHYVIKRTFRLLKTRFRCLNKSEASLQFEPDRVVLMITVCAILHNMAVNSGQLVDEDSEEEKDEHHDVPVSENHEVDEIGVDVRERVLRQYFADVDSD